MTATLKIRVEPDFCHFFLLFRPYHFCRQAENIQVVVAAAHLSCNLIVARGGANTRNLICCNCHPDTSTAKQDSSVHRAISNLTGNISSYIWIINCCFIMAPTVFYRMTVTLQESDQTTAGINTSMIASDRNFHSFNPGCRPWLPHRNIFSNCIFD